MGIRPVTVNGSNIAKVPDPLKPGEPHRTDEHDTKLWNPDWTKPPSDHDADAFLKAVTTVVLCLTKVSGISDDIDRDYLPQIKEPYPQDAVKKCATRYYQTLQLKWKGQENETIAVKQDTHKENMRQ